MLRLLGMMGVKDVKRLYESIEFLKSQLVEIKQDIKEIKEELELSPTEVKEIEKIIEQGRFKTFSNIKELRKAVEQ